MSIPQIMLTLDEKDRVAAAAAILHLQSMFAATAASRPLGNDPANYNSMQKKLAANI